MLGLAGEPAERMLRVLDGKVRAYLSNSYMRMDHYEISACAPRHRRSPPMCSLSVVISRTAVCISKRSIPIWHWKLHRRYCKMGVVISNSEVGLGSVSVQPLIYRELNGNGIVVDGATTKRIHRGRVNSAKNILCWTTGSL